MPSDTFTRGEIETPHGVAVAHLHRSDKAVGGLVLGHGAGGGVGAPDLVAATSAALESDLTVALVEQPYRVAGRRSPAPAHQLDAAWIAVVEQLRAGALAGLPLVTGGRSSGARVACRTAAALDSVGVLCLAFPLRPPRRDGTGADRLPELDAVAVPVLVVQGAGDPFGMPPPGRSRTVVEVRGNHSLRTDLRCRRDRDPRLAALGRRAGARLTPDTAPMRFLPTGESPLRWPPWSHESSALPCTARSRGTTSRGSAAGSAASSRQARRASRTATSRASRPTPSRSTRSRGYSSPRAASAAGYGSGTPHRSYSGSSPSWASRTSSRNDVAQSRWSGSPKSGKTRAVSRKNVSSTIRPSSSSSTWSAHGS